MELFLETKLAKKIPDKLYVSLEFYSHIGHRLHLSNPQTFNEKLQWLKLYDHRPEYTGFVDKHEAKKLIAQIIGDEYIIPELGIWEKPEDIDFSSLPEQFVLKVTHDSGGLIICKNKQDLCRNQVVAKLNNSLKRDYYIVHREWPYKNVKKQIIAEPLLGDGETPLIDYKLMCFNGEVKLTFVCSDRFSSDGLKVTFFDNDWNKMPFKRHYECSKEIIKKPHSFEKMKELAEKLSKGIPFVRVDFYEIDEKPYFGEMTFYPGSGYEEFSPEKYDHILGSWIQLPIKNSQKE